MGWLGGSCTKTEDYDPLPEDKILEYKVINLPDGDVIYGAVDNQQNTITVYVPLYLGLLVIDPVIEVSPGATLQEGVDPVNVDTKDKTYTVKAANGSSRTYKLQISTQSPNALKVRWRDSPGKIQKSGPRGSLPRIIGNFGQRNPNLIRVELIAKADQKRYVMNTSEAGVHIDGWEYFISFSSIGSSSIPVEILAGEYNVEVSSFGHTVVLEDPLLIEYKQPVPYIPYSELKFDRKSDWEIIPMSYFLGPKKVTATVAEKEYELKIKEWTRRKLIVNFPADFPKGELGYVPVKFDFEGWASITKYANLIITE